MNTIDMQPSFKLAPLYFPCADEAWVYLLRRVMEHGSREVARGLSFNELIGYSTSFSMAHPLVSCVQRKLSLKYAYGEAWWILTGRQDVESLARYNERIREYSDDGETFFGAYGPPILAQLPYIVRALVNDSGSRQSVLTIWRQCPRSTKDVPCTVAIQFLVRDGKLYCLDTMRSSDAWLGWPYDVFTFTCLSALIALILKEEHSIDLELGALVMQCGSQHVYSSDESKVARVFLNSTFNMRHPLDLKEFSGADEFISWLRLRAEAYLVGNTPSYDSKKSLTLV